MAETTNESYGLAPESSREDVPAPLLAYQPRDPASYRPKIALVGCGGIAVQHLRAYVAAGYDVAALCDVVEERAENARLAYFPAAKVYTEYREVLRRDDIEVVDLAVHPQQRVTMCEDAIEAGKHILSQKPFVLDIDVGLRLVERAEHRGVRLAVNQNGRWAPHWSYLRAAIDAGLLGQVQSVRASVNWNHNWMAGSVFDKVKFLILYDFGIHWFDIVNRFMRAHSPRRIFASMAHAKRQKAKPALLSQAVIEYDDGQASLVFDANTLFGEQDLTYITGTAGSAWSEGPSLNEQRVTLATPAGLAHPVLEGSWFPDGFHGSMAELLRSVEGNREPENGGRENLRSLELCFAAVASADSGTPVVPGSVRRLLE